MDKEKKTLFKFEDNITPYLKRILDKNPNYINKAIGSLGWFLRKKSLDVINTGSGSGITWHPLSDIQGKHQFSINSRLKNKRRNVYSDGVGKFYGRLGRAIVYRKNKQNFSLSMGFLSRSASRISVLLQAGKKTKVTPKMRRLFYVSGYSLTKNEIIQPARPLIQNIFDYHKKNFSKYIEYKIRQYYKKDNLI